MKKYEPYRGVIVCTLMDEDDNSKAEYVGVLSAKRVNSPAETGDYMYSEILSLIENNSGNARDGSGSVTVSTWRDTFDEWVTEVKCRNGSTYRYKLMFEEEEGGETDEAEDRKAKKVQAEPG